MVILALIWPNSLKLQNICKSLLAFVNCFVSLHVIYIYVVHGAYYEYNH